MTTWGRIVTSRARWVVALAVSLFILSGIWGLGVLGDLNLAGYADPASSSTAAGRLMDDTPGGRRPDVVVIYTAPPGRTLDDIGPQVLDRIRSVDAGALAEPIESYWTATGIRRGALRSTDQREALATVVLAGDDGAKLRNYPALADHLAVDGVSARFAGYTALTDAYNTKSKTDVVLAESVAIPVMLILLVVIFGGLVAAAAPVLVGGLAVFGSLGALRAISTVSDVSAFSMNIASIIGLGLAIDYSLFVVSRFREELAAGRDPAAAAARTVETAGRTIVFSALLLIGAFAGSLVFPISMLRSLGYGAIAAIAIAAILALTALPAALALLGTRIDAVPWRRGAVQRGEARARRFWSGLARWIMGRPVAVAGAIVLVLVALSLPLAGMRTGGIDPNGLPAHDPARVAQETLAGDFPNATDGATLVVRGRDGQAPPDIAVQQLIVQAGKVNGVRLAVQLTAAGDRVLVRTLLTHPDFSPAAEDTVRALRQLPAPPGTTVLVGGMNAERVDSYSAIVRSIPDAVLVILAATLLLMCLGFRSIVLPLKAVAMAALSLGATFGVLTLIFVDGYGAGVLGVEPGPLPLPALVVITMAVFGLSTDYEVFLMSRMVEAHDRGADTPAAIEAGVARTGRIITAAASLFIIVTGAAALSQVALIKVAALGMALAILIDATLVRMLLVPAIMALMGSANWWTPFRRKHTRSPADPGELDDDAVKVPSGSS
ncbi:MMPL family transporter [Nocardia sp. BMG111209]|uniref:MMPL family transporter n=1 Tax=Nocardia sp. BMG111209 TaxID=1160137 RepID=UPI00037D4BBA|nr:MMPL family transporter [Nocardia sp. BMG111209]